MDIAPTRQISLKIKLLTGCTKEVVLDENATIATLKTKIQEKEGIPPAQQRLIYSGKVMMETRTLEECDLKNGSTVYLILAIGC